MTLVFGMKLASATPILLTFDWTGQCDDCQGPNGAIDVPGTNMDDGYTQDVSGLLKVNYDPDIDPLFTQFEFVSFVYNGSSILDKVEASDYHFDDISSAFTIVGNTVEVTTGEQLLFDAPGFTYKGDFEDVLLGDIIYENGNAGKVDRVYYYIRLNRSSLEGFSLESYYETVAYNPPVECTSNCGNDGPRSGGSRDIGYDSKFVMRGTLPSPLASPIPEPSTITIFALGVLGLSLRRKKCA